MNFLLEIGTEEIPHWMIPGALAQLEKLDLFGATPRVDATPRRLVVRAEGLPDRTPDTIKRIAGPNKSAGALAINGFAKKQQVDPSEVILEGDQYILHKKVLGREVRDLLAESLPASILGLQWPKTMYWGAKGSPRFIRPIRWIVALLGDEIIPFEIAGVKSGSHSRGHRVLGNAKIMVDYGSLESQLRSNMVILGTSERRNKIEKEAKELGATLDPDLVETLTYITEYPAAIKGDFDRAYLELPAEVLTMVMRHHQKYFAVETSPGVLAPHFVAVMNIPADPDGEVKKGNERVLKARFNDARFFWEVDQKKKLADRLEDLKQVSFQAKLGSYWDKAYRVLVLVTELGGSESAQRAALLCKADLTTEMVKEFTDLQGIVGGLYAKHQGEPETVSQAIYEHYKPLSMEDSIPSTRAGQILSVADKFDTLREFFRIGLVPTGSKDPFALRRAAQGIVRIWAETTVRQPYDIPQELQAFLLERAHHYFREVRGFKYDEINAVLASGWRPISNILERLTAVSKVRTTKDFEPLAASFKRMKNILRQADFAPEGPINRALLEAGPERDLFEEYQRVSAIARSSATPFENALAEIATLRPNVDAFFDKVLVNAGDPRVRENRLALLYHILKEFSTIADFSEIVTSGDQK